MTPSAPDAWVVYSPNESSIGHGAGFWSDTNLSWVEFDLATTFPVDEARNMALPAAVSRDARFVLWNEAQHFYGC
ncbi:hypothetical protein DY952_10225 [Pseudomonas aeruginosa]|nr:hypothetical protein DY952_10225 [Pseudomonas aeruginosa]